MPGQPLLVELFHEWIRVEVLDIPYARLAPDTLEEHHGAYHGGHTGGIAYALHACLLISLLVLAVVVDIVGVFLAGLDAADAATDRGLAVVVLAQVLRIGQHGLEELQGNYLYLDLLATTIGQRSLVLYLVDTRHA